jgi:hypothetical protein
MTGTISQRRRLWIASVGAGILAIFALGYGNQSLESWRWSQWEGDSRWLRPFLGSLDEVAWRFTAPTEAQAQRIWVGLGVSNPNHAWLGAIVRDVAVIVLGWLLIYAAGRGVGAVRGRAAVFFAVLGAVVIAVVVPYVAVVPLQFGTALSGDGPPQIYYSALDAGLITGMAAGLLVALVSALIYRNDPNALASPFAPPFAEPMMSPLEPTLAEPGFSIGRNDPDADTLIEGFEN